MTEDHEHISSMYIYFDVANFQSIQKFLWNCMLSDED